MGQSNQIIKKHDHPNDIQPTTFKIDLSINPETFGEMVEDDLASDIEPKSLEDYEQMNIDNFLNDEISNVCEEFHIPYERLKNPYWLGQTKVIGKSDKFWFVTNGGEAYDLTFGFVPVVAYDSVYESLINNCNKTLICNIDELQEKINLPEMDELRQSVAEVNEMYIRELYNSQMKLYNFHVALVLKKLNKYYENKISFVVGPYTSGKLSKEIINSMFNS